MSNSATSLILLEVHVCLKGLSWEAVCAKLAEFLPFSK